MFQYIDRLRKRPLAERRRAANTITVVVILAIAALWLLYGAITDRIGIASREKEPARVQDGVIQGPYEKVP